MEASFFLSPLRDGRCGPMRGALPLGSKSADLAPTPRSGGAVPPRPHREGAPPHTPGVFMQGWQPLHPPVGLPGPHPGFLSFHDERNQRRAGAAPLAPQCVVAALFTLAYASRRATFCLQLRPICHFEMGGRIGLFFSPGVAEVTLSIFKPWRGSAGRLESRTLPMWGQSFLTH